MSKVHPTAIVSDECEIGPGVEVGPYCVIRGRVTLGEGVRLIGNATLAGECGSVVIGPRTTVFPYVCIGFPGQDLKFKPGMKSAGVTVGADCILRENVTIHSATKEDRPTAIGDRVFMMVCSHVGHDARVGNDVTMVNNVALGGHSDVADRVIMGGGSVLHQFARIGRMAFISGGSAFSADVPPYCLGSGRNGILGLNLVGLRRAGIPRDQITIIRQAFREVLKPVVPRAEALQRLEELGRSCPPVLDIHRFITESKRSIAAYRTHSRNNELSSAEPAEV